MVEFKNLFVKQLKENLFQIQIGVVSAQVSKQTLCILIEQIAAVVDVNILEDKQLKDIFERYDALQMTPLPTLRFQGGFNAKSTKEKPLG